MNQHPKPEPSLLDSLTIFLMFWTTAALVAAVIIDQSGFFYAALRWMITICSAVFVYRYFESKNISMIATYFAVAILFNPIAPIYLDKSVWVVVDLVVAAITGVAFYSQYTSVKNKLKAN